MEVLWIIVGVFILYWRCLDYNYLIDDNVRMWGYLYIVPEQAPNPSFYSSKPPKSWRLYPIILHCMNIFVISQLWGWKVALLFAVFPINVSGVAWMTGGYYSLTTFFALISWFFVTIYTNIIGGLIGSIFYTAALGCTIAAIGLPFVFLFLGPKIGLLFFWPVVAYIFGKRFTAGFKIRDRGKKDIISWRKLAVVVKVIAYYAWLTIYPYRLSFFRQFGFDYSRKGWAKEWMDSFNNHFWVSLVGLSAFLGVCWHFSQLGTVWWLVTIAPFSQYKVLGQFIAERYMYLPSIGWCLVLHGMIGNYPILLAIVVTLYLYRSHLYIPAFKCMVDMYKNGIANYPGCVSNYCNLAERYLHLGDTNTSRKLLDKALIMDPESFLAHTNLAAYWVGVSQFEQALYHCNLSIEYSMENSTIRKLMLDQRAKIMKTIEEQKKKGNNGYRHIRNSKRIKPVMRRIKVG